jgi:hypothetical protein
MNTSMNPETRKRLRTSDLAAAGTVPPERDEFSDPAEVQTQSQAQALGQTSPAIPTLAAPGSEQLEALFPADTAAQYRARWSEVQGSFVDDPRRAVADGDELVAEVMQSLAESFAHERQRLEDELSHTGEASTEALRVGLRRYRSFFERLLSL